MKFAILITLSLFFVTGCGIFDTKDKGKKIQQNDSEIAGKWQSNCVGAETLELTHTQREYNFNAIGDFDKTERFYANKSCSNPGFTYQISGTYAALGSHHDNNEIKQVNFTVDKAVVTVNSKGAVDLLNDASLCGKSDWAVGSETDITGKNCAGFSVKKGDVVFDVYDLQDGNLYFGQKFFFLSSDDADSRPDSISEDVVFKRK